MVKMPFLTNGSKRSTACIEAVTYCPSAPGRRAPCSAQGHATQIDGSSDKPLDCWFWSSVLELSMAP